ncbi:hypothetical protein [Paenarthrobacter sp. NPDC058040]|uniref:DUF6414 family protein n=1 Tax=unclassified Paenarthrobacter TaxID=2634190 RepID=UPI0036D7F228
MREFVYLDEMTLRSLLASQDGEEKDQVTRADTYAEQVELNSKITGSNLALKAEVGSRFQTTSTQNVQTTRKAIVQSRFRDFLGLVEDQLVLSVESGRSNEVQTSSETKLIKHTASRKPVALPRGSLLEVEVELSADPIYKMSAMFTEIAEISKDSPGLVANPGTAKTIGEIDPANKILQRLLVGLVPIRAHVVSHVVVVEDGVELIVPRKLAEHSKLHGLPIEVVGVTEQQSYWKDLRRVLFSNSRFTMLCRVGRSGLQNEWMPVKLQGLFHEISPELSRQIGAIGSIDLAASQPSGDATAAHRIFSAALTSYAKQLLLQHCPNLKARKTTEMYDFVTALDVTDVSASAQRSAFRSIEDYFKDTLEVNIPSDEASVHRERVRRETGLGLLGIDSPAATNPPSIDRPESSRLLDTEIIAIYW